MQYVARNRGILQVNLKQLITVTTAKSTPVTAQQQVHARKYLHLARLALSTKFQKKHCFF